MSSASHVAVNKLGQVVLSGSFHGELALGTGLTVRSNGADDVFLVKLTP